jgi:hypothetical protein
VEWPGLAWLGLAWCGAVLLCRFTHNSIHLISPFDSGGSSAVIREAFDMMAVGDIRNRLMSLADETVHGRQKLQFSLV